MKEFLFRFTHRPFLALHLFSAAIRAISRLLSAVKVMARALPPFSPPNRANCTVGLSTTGSASFTAPTERSTISFPSWFGSRGRFWCFIIPLLWLIVLIIPRARWRSRLPFLHGRKIKLMHYLQTTIMDSQKTMCRPVNTGREQTRDMATRSGPNRK